MVVWGGVRGEFGGFFDCVLSWVVSEGIGRGREGREWGGDVRMRLMVGDLVLNWGWVVIVEIRLA